MSEETTVDAASSDEEIETTDTETPEPDEGADALGDAGKKALDAMKAKMRTAEKAAKDARAELAKRDAELALRDKPAEEQALEQARAEARAEATTAANKRIVRSELKAAAAGKLANPAVAEKFLDLDDFDVDDNGDVDSDALNEAIADLLKREPYLAAGKPNPFQGSGDGGSRAEPKPDQSIDEAIEAARKAHDFPLVATLRHQKYAAEQAKKGQ